MKTRATQRNEPRTAAARFFLGHIILDRATMSGTNDDNVRTVTISPDAAATPVAAAAAAAESSQLDEALLKLQAAGVALYGGGAGRKEQKPVRGKRGTPSSTLPSSRSDSDGETDGGVDTCSTLSTASLIANGCMYTILDKMLTYEGQSVAESLASIAESLARIRAVMEATAGQGSASPRGNRANPSRASM